MQGKKSKIVFTSCLYDDLKKEKEEKKKIWRRERLLGEAMLADVLLQVNDFSPF